MDGLCTVIDVLRKALKVPVPSLRCERSWLIDCHDLVVMQSPLFLVDSAVVSVGCDVLKCKHFVHKFPTPPTN